MQMAVFPTLWAATTDQQRRKSLTSSYASHFPCCLWWQTSCSIAKSSFADHVASIEITTPAIYSCTTSSSAFKALSESLQIA